MLLSRVDIIISHDDVIGFDAVTTNIREAKLAVGAQVSMSKILTEIL
jgi:hypothetical protein